MAAPLVAIAQDLESWALKPAREAGDVSILPVLYKNRAAKLQLCHSSSPMRVLSEPAGYNGAERKTLLLSHGDAARTIAPILAHLRQLLQTNGTDVSNWKTPELPSLGEGPPALRCKLLPNTEYYDANGQRTTEPTEWRDLLVTPIVAISCFAGEATGAALTIVALQIQGRHEKRSWTFA